jgi:hypothetical protein
MVRVTDRKRGWGLFYSKACKAREQEGRTGQYANYCHRRDRRESFNDIDYEHGWDGHKKMW